MIEQLKADVLNSFPKEYVVDRIEIPPNSSLGDLAVPCFGFSHHFKKSPALIAQELVPQLILSPLLERAEPVGGYINFFFNKIAVAQRLLASIADRGEFFAAAPPSGKKILLDYSAPNIAKPFGIGHLRSTIIGQSLKRMFEYRGFETISVNHIGDWGTQYGKLVRAWELWGNKDELDKDPLGHLYALYVKFHTEEEINPALADEGRAAFARLEKADPAAITLWELFRELSLNEFKKYYALLNVEFDSYDGEGFYRDKIAATIEAVHKTGNVEHSDGALVVPLSGGKPPLILVKSDSTSTYATRDLATALYRLATYAPDTIVYVVGAPQKLHFEQVFAVLEMMGHHREHFVHVDFGHFKFPEGKMSTRKGNIIFLEDVLDKAIQLATTIITQKNPTLPNKSDVARVVGLGAIIFGDLYNDRVRDIIFDWDRVLSFEGETGPYLQYTHARLCSILRHVPETQGKVVLTDDREYALVRRLLLFEGAITDSLQQYKPSVLAHYLMDLGQEMNELYQNCPVAKATGDVQHTRRLLVDSVRLTLKQGLFLLGIEAPTEM